MEKLALSLLAMLACFALASLAFSRRALKNREAVNSPSLSLMGITEINFDPITLRRSPLLHCGRKQQTSNPDFPRTGGQTEWDLMGTDSTDYLCFIRYS